MSDSATKGGEVVAVGLKPSRHGTLTARRSGWAPYRRHAGLIRMIALPLAVFVLFNYVPMVGLIIAFKNFAMKDGMLASQWVGLENFYRLFSGPEFLRALRNTVIISVLRLGFGFFVPVILALMLNELRLTLLKKSVQTLTYVPYFFSWVILGGIFIMMLTGGGPIDSAVRSAGAGRVEFLSDPVWFVVVLVATGIWQGAGHAAVIYLAALATIDPNLYEAAAVDGASRWRQTLHVTLPCLVPTMIVLFILSLGGILSAGFDQIFNMYNPSVYVSADIIDTYVLRRLIAMDFSLATAAGMFKSVVGMVLIVAANWGARRMSRGEQGIW
ncbi:MAG: ABC transporter permease subunit [Planctomycetaceae bacterium]|nr:ABC transporter permease subunit [Planctomycetaceae bacterium]